MLARHAARDAVEPLHGTLQPPAVLSSAITYHLGRKKKKKERQQLMWLFGRMQQASTVEDLDRFFKCVCQLLLSREVPNHSIKIREEEDNEDEV